MQATSASITNEQGHKLHTQIEWPANQKPHAFALIAHCFTCNSRFHAIKNISRALATEGFAVIKFDFTGLGHSEGEFKDSHFAANISDLISVYNFIKQKYKAPELLIGHSLGGAAVIAAASQLEDVKAVVTIGTPSDIRHVKKHFKSNIKSLHTQDSVEVEIGGRPFRITKAFVDQFDKFDLLPLVRHLKRPLLIMHAPFDAIVGVENAQTLFSSAFHPKSFISLDDADHLLQNEKDSLYAGSVISKWVNKYIPKPERTPMDLDTEQLVAHLNFQEDNYTTHIQLQNHNLIADEPLELGGDDYGPSPYELLISSLAACTTMTLKMYIQRKQWPVEEIFVYISHSKEKYMDSQGKTKNKDVFRKKIEILGPLTEEQKNRMLQIADKCPVHKTLTNEVEIISALKS